MRADVVDVEHRPGALVAVGRDPRRDGRDDVADLRVAAAKHAAGIRDGRQRPEPDVLRVGVAAADGLARLDEHVALFIFLVEERYAAIARVIGYEGHVVGLAAQHVPHHALGLVAGDGHAHARGIARGQSLDGHIVVHVCFLSQPLTGCVQKPQFLRRVGGKCLQPGALRGQARIERRAVVIQAQQLARVAQAEAERAQRGDASGGDELPLAVVAVAGHGIDFRRGEQPHLIIVAQHTNADSGQF